MQNMEDTDRYLDDDLFANYSNANFPRFLIKKMQYLIEICFDFM